MPTKPKAKATKAVAKATPVSLNPTTLTVSQLSIVLEEADKMRAVGDAVGTIPRDDVADKVKAAGRQFDFRRLAFQMIQSLNRDAPLGRVTVRAAEPTPLPEPACVKDRIRELETELAKLKAA